MFPATTPIVVILAPHYIEGHDGQSAIYVFNPVHELRRGGGSAFMAGLSPFPCGTDLHKSFTCSRQRHALINS
jgi:hypothetical protein